MDGLQLSRTSAAFVTFLLSALCHELVMAVVTKKIRPYLFLMQVSRSPHALRWLAPYPIPSNNSSMSMTVSASFLEWKGRG
jgi:sterol O-acyltransferase